MRLSSKTRIGVQALYDMAFHCRGQQAQAKEIAERQQIPLRTLEEVLQELRKAGLVEAQRGPRGGYMLARLPAQITLSQIVRALEGPVETLFALRGDPSHKGRRRRVGEAASARAGHTTRAETSDSAGVPDGVWGDIVDRIAAVLGEATLGDVVARAERAGAQRQLTDLPPTMYFI